MIWFGLGWDGMSRVGLSSLVELVFLKLGLGWLNLVSVFFDLVWLGWVA